ncbi:metal ABC transporter permease [Paenibacillus dokdonensis]|uniref:Metal ABC transporter permease n=2 Tax=Paenibacillus dokdonensis TaxID=2567944 RepID=A0ABU6GR90_9BACL|nr:metal ABC transporter permease [Paenibacillus dokdonensis]MEC0242265.1 metal ABC transporter permease [Paenibacillus dokdonensis]
MFQYDFMQRAFLAGGLIALIAPLLGVYLVLRRQSLMSDTLSHVSMAGVALGTVLHVSPVLCGFLFAIMGGLMIEQLRRTYKTYSEVPVAIIMTSGLALAMVLMSLKTTLNKSFSSYLFGSIVAVSSSQLIIIAVVTLIGLLFFMLLRRPLYSLTFEEDTAAVSGVRVKMLSFAFAIVAGMIVAAAMPIVGVLLVSSLIVLPSAFALRFAGGFVSASMLAVVTGMAGVFSGLTASYYTDTPPGGSIALILLIILLAGIGLQRALKLAKKRRTSKTEAILRQQTNQTIHEGVLK